MSNYLTEMSPVTMLFISFTLYYHLTSFSLSSSISAVKTTLYADVEGEHSVTFILYNHESINSSSVA